VRTPPDDLPQADLASLLAEAWDLHGVDLEHAPVGFGSHHWVATDPTGGRRFVTVDQVGDGRIDRLRKALLAARTLHEDAGLGWVVGPLPATDGAVLKSLGPGYAAAVYPYVDARPFPDDPGARDRELVVDMVAALHAATPVGRRFLATADLQVAGRAHLELALLRLHEPWTGGPFGEPARALLAARADDVRVLLREHDRLADLVRRAGSDWVVTHGEVKPDNVLVSAVGLMLVDWDTALLAPAARDLWQVASDDGGELDRYADRTGREVTRAELAFYRLDWQLADIAEYARWLGGPHQRSADTEIAWTALVANLDVSDRWLDLL
jgi:spectinomycin phosphotransferase